MFARRMQGVKILVILLFLSTGIQGFNQDGYRIEATIAGMTDSTSLLAFHMGNRQYIQDTAMVDTRGHFVFEGRERLKPGMYIIFLPETNASIEIIIDQNQHFSLTTRRENLVPALQFDNSPENTAFYDYITFLQSQNLVISELQKTLEDDKTDPGQKDETMARIREKEHSITEKQNQHMTAFPDGLFSMVLLAQRMVDVSDVQETGDQNLIYEKYKQRYWDHVDFSDDRIVRSPVYHSMLDRFINQVLLQIPDTIIAASDRLLEKARANSEMFRYTLWFLSNNAERSQIMGMDAVFVHLAENYYNKGEAFWMNAEGLERIQNRADRLGPLLIGRIAPDLYGFDPDGKKKSLQETKAEYTILYFWEADCSHCQAQTPVLIDLYSKYQDNGLKVYALNTEADENGWKKAINRYDLKWINVNDIHNRSGFRDTYDITAIPTIFLLDKDKRIIAKRINAEQIDGFMQFELNRKSMAE